MAGTGSQRTGLAPARYSSVDQAGIDCPAIRRAQTQVFGDARPEPLQQHVGFGGHRQYGPHAVAMMQIHDDRAAVAAEHVLVGWDAAGRWTGPLDANDLCAHVRQEHGRIRTRADARELDDLEAVQRTSRSRLTDQA